MNSHIRITGKFQELALLAAVFLSPLVFWLPVNEAFETPKTTVFYSLLGLSAALLLSRQSLSGSFSFKWTGFSLPAAAIILVSILSMLKGAALNIHALPLHWQFTKLVCSAALLYFLIINTFTRAGLGRILFFIFLAHFLVVTYGIFQYAGIDMIKWVSFGKGRVYSTMGNPDYMSAQFSLLIPVMLGVMLSPVNKLARFFTGLYLAFMIFLVIVAQGRGAWLGFFGSLVYMAALLWLKNGKEYFIKHKPLFASILALIIIFSIALYQPLKERIKHGLSFTSDSVAVRLHYWESALHMAAANPILGVGMGGFSLNSAFYQRKVLDRWEKAAPEMAAIVEPHVELYTHNDFLQNLAEKGFLGLSVFLWVVLAGLLLPLRMIKEGQDIFTRNLLVGLSAASAAFIINGFFNFPWRVAPTLILLWALYGVFSLHERKTAVRREKTGLYKIIMPLSLAAAVIFSAAAFLSFFSNSSIKAGQAQFAAGRYEEARSTFLRGLSSNPRGTDVIELVLYCGNSFNALGDVDSALKQYKRGLLMFPHFIESRYNIANVYMNNGMFDEAMAQYEKVLELNPKFTAAMNNMANIYYNSGELEKAMPLYNRALALKPSLTEARFNLAAAYFRQARYKEAHEEFSKVLEYNPAYEPAKEWAERTGRLTTEN
ncbi:MAG TPA: tetratricopeptide repeat protein [bacterium]|nr:tetratricopeptide repeat protein [bacterium]